MGYEMVCSLNAFCFLQVANTNFSVCIVIADDYKNVSVLWNGEQLKYPPALITDGVFLNLQLCCNYYGAVVVRGKC
jgi:hypothetical protein